MFLKILFSCGLFFAFFQLANWQNEGFSLHKIFYRNNFTQNGEVVNSLSEKELKEIFCVPFDYLSKGAQTYVFASRDGKYVIKFFRFFNKYATPFYFLPFESIQKTVAKRNGKLNKDFNSYKIAFEQLKEETGLVFLHLKETNNLKTTITFYDKMKVQYKLSLDKVGFILQKRATPFYPTLDHWIKEGKTDEAKKALKALVHLLLKQEALGIFDKDPNLETNFGFLKDTPIQMDIGRFKKNGSQKNMEHILSPLQHYLNENSLELAQYLKNEISL